MRYSYKKAIQQLTEYAIREGYNDIELDYNDVSMIKWDKKSLSGIIIYEPKSIYIQGKYTLELKTYLMLHELGHHELRKDWDKFKKKFPAMAHAEHIHLKTKATKYKRRDTYVVSSLEEEFKAWDEGKKLGDKFGIKINMQKWIAFKSKCLKNYINYFANLKK